jgi:hypothetical protein
MLSVRNSQGKTKQRRSFPSSAAGSANYHSPLGQLYRSRLTSNREGQRPTLPLPTVQPIQPVSSKQGIQLQQQAQLSERQPKRQEVDRNTVSDGIIIVIPLWKDGLVLKKTVDNFEAGSLASAYPNWQSITSDPWIVSTILG